MNDTVKLAVVIMNQEHEVYETHVFGFNTKKAAQIADRHIKEVYGEDNVLSRLIFDGE